MNITHIGRLITLGIDVVDAAVEWKDAMEKNKTYKSDYLIEELKQKEINFWKLVDDFKMLSSY